MDRNNAFCFFNAHERQLLLFLQIKLYPDGGTGFRRGASVLGVSLAGMNITQIKQGSWVKNREEDSVANGHVTNV